MDFWAVIWKKEQFENTENTISQFFVVNPFSDMSENFFYRKTSFKPYET